MSYRIIYTESYLKRAASFVKKHPELISQYGKTLKRYWKRIRSIFRSGCTSSKAS